jgi:hypothetical protein
MHIHETAYLNLPVWKIWIEAQESAFLMVLQVILLSSDHPTKH